MSEEIEAIIRQKSGVGDGTGKVEMDEAPEVSAEEGPDAAE